MITAEQSIRIARPSADLAAAERFYAGGLGLSAAHRAAGRLELGEHDLLMVGPPNGRWHLELTAGTADPVAPSPTAEDLLVIYLGVPVDAQSVARAVEGGGTVVPAHNPYWDRGGVTIADPDGYRIVLTERHWGLNTSVPDIDKNG